MVVLPPADVDKSGWPWYHETTGCSPAASLDLPRLSIITPSMNQGDYIEETIRSVLLQGYPALEFIVIDGGSTDQTIEILKKYSAFITYWVSEPDRGQSHAINKGLDKASGDLIAWLNSDDLYYPGALLAVGQAYANNNGALIAGSVMNFDEHQEWVVGQPGLINGLATFWRKESLFHQPGIFVPKALWNNYGNLDESLHMCMDFDLLCHIHRQKPQVVILDQPLAKFRVHATSKTTNCNAICLRERTIVSRRYWNDAHVDSAEHDKYVANDLTYFVNKCLGNRDMDGAFGLMKVAYELGPAIFTSVLLYWPRRIMRKLLKLAGKREHP